MNSADLRNIYECLAQGRNDLSIRIACLILNEKQVTSTDLAKTLGVQIAEVSTKLMRFNRYKLINRTQCFGVRHGTYYLSYSPTVVDTIAKVLQVAIETPQVKKDAEEFQRLKKKGELLG